MAHTFAKPIPTILLVEDSEDDSYFFQRALQRSGQPCGLTHVRDGAAAVEALQKALSGESKLPDLIFLDLKMPVMSGFEVLQWIRAQNIAQAVPVIVLSGSDQQADQTRALRLGAADFLVKPITPGTLAERLQALKVAAVQQS
jgi:CheY-like chemotaxis protein